MEASVNIRSGASRPSGISTTSTVLAYSLAGKPRRIVRQDCAGSCISGTIPEMVGQTQQRPSREAASGTHPSVSNLHKCLEPRLGSPLRSAVSFRPVPSRGVKAPRERVGTVGHSKGNRSFCAHVEEPSSDGPLRQQFSSGLSAEPGGNSVFRHVHLKWEILLERQQQGITMFVRHIPCRLNVLADNLSRKDQVMGQSGLFTPA